MCSIRSKVDCAANESASVPAHFDRSAMSHFVNRHCVLFVDAFGHDINGQAVGFDGNAVQMAVEYDS